MIYWRKRKRDVGRSVRHARGGGGDEEGFLTRAGWRQGTEGGEDVVGGGGAGCGFGTCRRDADGGDYDIGSAALEFKVHLQSSALRTPPLEMEMWESMAD